MTVPDGHIPAHLVTDPATGHRQLRFEHDGDEYIALDLDNPGYPDCMGPDDERRARLLEPGREHFLPADSYLPPRPEWKVPA